MSGEVGRMIQGGRPHLIMNHTSKKLTDWCSLETAVSVCTKTQTLPQDSVASIDWALLGKPYKWPYKEVPTTLTYYVHS